MCQHEKKSEAFLLRSYRYDRVNSAGKRGVISANIKGYANTALQPAIETEPRLLAAVARIA